MPASVVPFNPSFLNFCVAPGASEWGETLTIPVPVGATVTANVTANPPGAFKLILSNSTPLSQTKLLNKRDADPSQMTSRQKSYCVH